MDWILTSPEIWGFEDLLRKWISDDIRKHEEGGRENPELKNEQFTDLL